MEIGTPTLPTTSPSSGPTRTSRTEASGYGRKSRHTSKVTRGLLDTTLLTSLATPHMRDSRLGITRYTLLSARLTPTISCSWTETLSHRISLTSMLRRPARSGRTLCTLCTTTPTTDSPHRRRSTLAPRNKRPRLRGATCARCNG